MTPNEITKEIKRDSLFAFLTIFTISACISTCVYIWNRDCSKCKQKDLEIDSLNKMILKNNSRYLNDVNHDRCFRSE